MKQKRIFNNGDKARTIITILIAVMALLICVQASVPRNVQASEQGTGKTLYRRTTDGWAVTWSNENTIWDDAKLDYYPCVYHSCDDPTREIVGELIAEIVPIDYTPVTSKTGKENAGAELNYYVIVRSNANSGDSAKGTVAPLTTVGACSHYPTEIRSVTIKTTISGYSTHNIHAWWDTTGSNKDQGRYNYHDTYNNQYPNIWYDYSGTEVNTKNDYLIWKDDMKAVGEREETINNLQYGLTAISAALHGIAFIPGCQVAEGGAILIEGVNAFIPI